MKNSLDSVEWADDDRQQAISQLRSSLVANASDSEIQRIVSAETVIFDQVAKAIASGQCAT